MNYELAKQLKVAGFPLEWHRRRGKPDEIISPTLSELIEACGEKFTSLSKVPTSMIQPYKWTAVFVKFADSGQIFLEEVGVVHAVGDMIRHEEHGGDTPNEAVARLWLALNKPHL